MKKIIETEKGCWLISFLITTLFFLTIFFVRGIVFETVDDFNVMYTVAGYKTGQPYFQLTFYNNILAFIITLFYKITDKIQWYSVFQLAMLYLSAVSVGKVILDKASKKKLSIVFTIGIQILFYFIFFLYPVQRMQFTTTATMLGVAAVVLLYGIDYHENSTKDITRTWLISGIFLVVCFMERRMSWVGVVCFWMLGICRCIVYCYMVKGKRECISVIKKLSLYLAGIAIITLAINGGDRYIKNNYDNRDYMEYDEYRGMFQDYPRPSFEENPELYTEAGWDEDIYNLVSGLLYVDDNINKQSFQSIVDSSSFKKYQSVIDTLWRGKELIRTDDTAKALLMGVLVLFVWQLFVALKYRSKENIFHICITICACLGAFIISFYLCMRGRFLLRIFQNVALPVAGVLIINFMEIIGNIHNEKWRKNTKILFCGVILVTLLPGVIYTGKHVFFDLKAKDEYSTRQMHTFEDYAIEHPDEVFVHDYSISNAYNSYDPFRVFGDKKPTNIIISGGSYTYTGCYYKQLKLNGLEKLNGETFFNNKVFYVCDNTRKNFFNSMNVYMRNKYNAVGCSQQAVLDNNVGIYHFINGVDQDYTGLYTTLGQQIYFQNGKIQTGIFQIEGIEYRAYEYHEVIETEFENETYWMDRFGLIYQ